MTKLTETEIEQGLTSLSGWTLEEGSITKTFTFTDFKEAFAVMTYIAFESEARNHHPEWFNVYNRLTVKLNTHDAGGITQNDFDLAACIERITQGR
ncbi:MAG: 4a-hydroxytetrahydrobiopterin dehydratase [Flavobacteriaceae bacterium]|nr:4a-hydroxytetrahydrobiopterin dehydratase [Flavobacteriaceae bacterium]